MNPQMTWEQLFQQLFEQLSCQNQKIQALEKSIDDLQGAIKDLKNTPRVNVENIEYKFDQLKVEKLEGTLNIGLNPFSGDAIEEFNVSQKDLKVETPDYESTNDPDWLKSTQLEAENYLSSGGMRIIRTLARQMKVDLSEDVLNFILEDIRRQLPARIHFLQQVVLNQNHQNMSREEIRSKVLEAFEKDVKQAVEVFLMNLPKEMSGGTP